jgi:lysylphosphatidylglycerol synthetase-like protein (DUF2156 family)
MRATMVFGLACGLLFVPGLTVLRPLMGGPLAFRLLIWLCLAGYALLLAGWGTARRSALLYPVGMAAAMALVAPTRGVFLLLSLATLAWIRGGIVFPGRPLRNAAAELFLILGGAGLVVVFAPGTAVQWALAVWLFFVLQSLYFARGETVGESEEADPFEKARREAERILSGTP